MVNTTLEPRRLLKTVILISFFFVLIMGLISFSLSGDVSDQVLVYQTLAPTDSSAGWSVEGTFARNLSISKAAIPGSGRSDILRLSVTFENRSIDQTFENGEQPEAEQPEAHIVYTFDKPLNLLSYDMIVFWLYADSSVGRETSGYTWAAGASHGYSFYILDATNGTKGLRSLPICWIEWNRIAIPLRFQPNEVNSSWKDDVSLAMVKAIRIGLEAFDSVDERQCNLYVSSIEVLKANRFVLKDILGLALSSILIVISLIIIPYVTLLFCKSSNNRILTMIKDTLTLFKLNFLQKVCVIAVLLKFMLAFLSPLSSDFINITYGVTSAFPYSNVFATSPASGGFWKPVMHVIYNLWVLLPVDHPELVTIYPGSHSYPSVSTPIFYFLSTPGSFLLVFLIKLFYIIFDVVTGFIVSRIVVLTSGSQKLGKASFVMWLINPYTSLIAEMWGSMDIVMVCFLVLSAYLFDKGRRDLSAIALGISIGTRLFPALILPVYLIHMRKTKSATLQLHNSNVNLASIKFVMISLTTFFVSLIPNLLLGASRTGALKVVPDLDAMPDFFFFLGPIIEVYGFRIGITVVLFIVYLTVLSLPNYGRCLSFQESLLGAFLVLFAFSRWHPHFILWIIPFLIVDAYTSHRRNFFLLFMIITFTISITFFGFYLSTWGNSFFFMPNYTPLLTTLSTQLWTIGSNELFQLINGKVLLQSVFSGLTVSYLISIIVQKPKPAGKPV